MEKEELLREVLKYVRVKELIGEVVFDKLLFAKLDEIVADSENSLDDALAEMMKPMLKDFVLAKLEEALAE